MVRAFNNAYAATILNNAAGNNRTQTFNITQGAGVLTNDQPAGVAARTATPAAPAVTRLSGGGPTPATMTVSLSSNGSFSYTLVVANSVVGNTNIQNAKKGSYRFTYTETLNAVTRTATVTITVN